MTPEERIAELERARSLMEEASGIVRECLHMSGKEMRFGDLPDRISSLSESPSEDSIVNLIRELEDPTDGTPGWTRPLDSVKNSTRKPII
ncbi:MAG: hypothetical protein J5673_02685 [Candidatus Methanomethylophilaceae archaeon]|nr:hypothetical protein [Candidatus Methanomethylophilaceae archaeon]